MTAVRIWFTKTGEASYISLLDLQRVMQRSLKRSRLPVWYTMGFNPHIYMTFACPLPLGQESLVESVDVKTELDEVPFEQWQEALQKVMPLGIKVVRVAKPVHKAEQIAFARYELRFPSTLAEYFEQYNQLEQAVVLKKTKRGHKEINLKESLPVIAWETNQSECLAQITLPAGEGLNLNPSLFLNFFQEQLGMNSTEVSVLRTGLFLKNMEEFL